MERVTGFAQKKPTPVKRGGASYDATQQFCKSEIERYVGMYQQLKAEDQTVVTSGNYERYFEIDGKIETIEQMNADAIGPAGSMWSSIDDISKWIQFLL